SRSQTGAPVPVSGALIAVPDVVVLMLSVALLLPVSCGMNCTLMAQLSGDGPTCLLWQPSLVMANELAFAPVMVASDRVGDATSPSLETVNVAVSPLLPRAAVVKP